MSGGMNVNNDSTSVNAGFFTKIQERMQDFKKNQEALLKMSHELDGKYKSEATIILIVLGAVVLIRCLTLNNHSYLHCFFTYRALVTPIFALLAVMWLNIELPHKKGRRK